MNIYIYIYIYIISLIYIFLPSHVPHPTTYPLSSFFSIFSLSLSHLSVAVSPSPFYPLFLSISFLCSSSLFLSLSPPLRLHLSVALAPSPFLSSPFIQLLFFKDITTTPLHSGILGPPPSSVNLGGTTIVAQPTRNALQICSH
ncbi:hypothetical protein RchiOBHm_Chr3g0497481 [Rosa chinensis]|uniref:Uncharacterized protein n=1 Tax=Rosa chinensis TaxID=74649 RepID=A0A2P6RHQ1_ROSCH|nr:hypothetical protein RchiOBHm_Chr3g0497481 [Rosa chinensis]